MHHRAKHKEAKKNKGTMIGISVLLSKMAALKGKLSFLLKKKKENQLYSVLITKVKYL